MVPTTGLLHGECILCEGDKMILQMGDVFQ